MILSNAHCFLLENTSILNSRNYAFNLIKNVLCQNDGCINCQMVETFENPSLIHIDGFNNKIKSQDVIDIKNFCISHSINSNKKIIFLQGIENATPKAANSLLKFLEEPEEDILFILTTRNVANVFPTIQTRSEIIKVGDSETLESINDDVDFLLQNNFLNYDWGRKTKNELIIILEGLASKIKVHNNVALVKKILQLTNMLSKVNVNKNSIIAELILASKKWGITK